MALVKIRPRQPRVWNKKHDRNIPPGAVYVGRPTKWGNPFSHVFYAQVLPGNVTRTRGEALERYCHWLLLPEQDELRAAMKRELRGKDLVCWCAPLDCHADIILVEANYTNW